MYRVFENILGRTKTSKFHNRKRIIYNSIFFFLEREREMEGEGREKVRDGWKKRGEGRRGRVTGWEDVL